MRLVPALGGAFSNSLASDGVKVKCTIFSGSSPTARPPDVPPIELSQGLSVQLRLYHNSANIISTAESSAVATLIVI